MRKDDGGLCWTLLKYLGRKMPGLVQRNGQQFGNGCRIAPALSGSVSEDGIWSRHRADVTFDQLQKVFFAFFYIYINIYI